MKLKLLYPMAVVSLLISCNTTPDSESQSQNLTVYPNPAEYEADVAFQSSVDGGSLSVIDSHGDEFFSEPLNAGYNQFHVPLKGKPEGIFHVLVKQGNKSYTLKFIHL